jgi:ribonuclease Y
MEIVVGIIIGAAVGILATAAAGYRWLQGRLSSHASEQAELLDAAQSQAESIRREAHVEAREEGVKLRRELDDEIALKRREVAALEATAESAKREIRSRETDVERREQSVKDREANSISALAAAEKAKVEQLEQLERVSALTTQEAKDQLLSQAEELIRRDAATLIRQIEEEAQTEARERARNIVGDALQRVAASHASEMTVSMVELPSDDLKGRIIGREGRNIRALENVTGVEFIVDDTPQAVVLSAFDGVRREIAKVTLLKLIEDGRIHPSRIEEMYYQSKAEIEEIILKAGEQAVFEANCGKFHEEFVKLLGRLKYRTSYGQNVLKHTLEVVHLAGLMAGELGIDVKAAKRSAVIHDLGKALTHEVEGSHAAIAAELARKHGESETVAHAVEAHHYEVEPRTAEAALLIAADAISASRPGARGESLEKYVERLEKLERIASEKNGVERVYAIQAGREVRVFVRPEKISDDEAVLLSREIARSIEDQMQYPGQIKVTVIRESRAIEVAK